MVDTTAYRNDSQGAWVALSLCVARNELRDTTTLRTQTKTITNTGLVNSMGTATKVIIPVVIIAAGVAAYFAFNKSPTMETEPSHNAGSTAPMSAPMAEQNNNKPIIDNSVPESDEAGLSELEALGQTQQKQKREEEIELNEETGELLIKDPVTGEVVFKTIVDKELIPLTKQSLDLQMPGDLPESAFANDTFVPANQEAPVSVYPPESADQAPEQVILKDGDDVQVIDVPQDAQDLKIIEEIPDEDQDNH
ncbi:MAG: hypothetical protein MI750_05215 [Xanthomonadales bacterium]|nr:hypothetical protein [Xanthomonadales bacterium]